MTLDCYSLVIDIPDIQHYTTRLLNKRANMDCISLGRDGAEKRPEAGEPETFEPTERRGCFELESKRGSCEDGRDDGNRHNHEWLDEEV